MRNVAIIMMLVYEHASHASASRSLVISSERRQDAVINITIIIIIAEMGVFNVAGYLIDIEERRRWPAITAHGDNIPNKFRILKERHIQMIEPYQLPGCTKNSLYYIVPRSLIELTTSRLHSFIVAKVFNDTYVISRYLCCIPKGR